MAPTVHRLQVGITGPDVEVGSGSYLFDHATVPSNDH